MLRSAVTPFILAIAVAGSSACATKGFVNRQVKDVNEKVDSLGRSLEDTGNQTKRNEDAIAGVNQKTGAAQAAADEAKQAASAADNAAHAADSKAMAADAKADTIDKASKRLVYEVVLSEDEGQFKFGKTILPDEAKARIDELVGKLKADPNGAYIEVEGHTDAVGSKDVNQRIGLERAEAVKRYLFEQHQIPLHKINAISYGMEKPVASNKTKEGRAQNRRVVIRVLA